MRSLKRSDVFFFALLGVTALAIIGAIELIFLVTPEDAKQGIVQKIFYFHVPAAIAFYIGAIVCFVGSVGYLWRGTQIWDSLARSGGEVALVMGLIVFTTGPLWAAKEWGTYWKWDPRITTSTLSELVYIAYAVLRGFSGGGESERKFSAALGILGAANLPIIHYSVQKWGGTHPEVVTGKGGGIDASMVPAFLTGMFAFSVLAAVFVWLRLRQDMVKARLEAVIDEAAALGIGEDESETG